MYQISQVVAHPKGRAFRCRARARVGLRDSCVSCVRALPCVVHVVRCLLAESHVARCTAGGLSFVRCCLGGCRVSERRALEHAVSWETGGPRKRAPARVCHVMRVGEGSAIQNDLDHGRGSMSMSSDAVASG